MSWSDYLPSIAALVGIPATAVVTLWRENRIRRRQEKREDNIRTLQQEREDQLANRRPAEWVNQKWWERKAVAYSEITEAIWHIAEEDRREYNKVIEMMGFVHSQPIEDATEETIRQYSENQRTLRKAAGIGAFMISTEAANVLQDYFQEIVVLGAAEEHIPTIDVIHEASHKLLDAFTDAAMRDLRVRREESSK